MLFSLFAKKGSAANRRNRAIMSVGLMACIAFIALAIVGWDLPVAKALNFLLVTVILVGALIGTAWLVVFLWHQLKKLFP